MPDPIPPSSPKMRITCMAHDSLGSRIMDCLARLKLENIIQENARAVRHRIRSRWGWIPGTVTTLNDTPMEVYRLSVPRSDGEAVAAFLIEAAELRAPGHGMLYVQAIEEYAERDLDSPDLPDRMPDHGMLKGMALLTCILSQEGSGQVLASVALRLGTGVPIVSRGTGTGLRDRLGLLRITISPEKEIVRLLIPAQDAPNLRHLLMEEGRMDRPGGGFMYQTTVAQGLADPLLRIGRQEHAASMEQLIVAMDDLKGGTAWRKRLDMHALGDPSASPRTPSRIQFKEIRFDLPEGHADPLIAAALNAGANGITTTQTQCLRPGESGDGGARETGLLCVPATAAPAVCTALYNASIRHASGGGWRIQVIDAPAAFSYQRRSYDPMPITPIRKADQ